MRGKKISKKRRLVSFCFSFFFCASLFLFGSVFDAHAFAVSPATIEVDVSAGSSTSGVIRLSNNDDARAQTYVTEKRPFIAEGIGGAPVFLPESATSAAAWIQVEAPEIKMPAGETIEVPYQINVPSDAAPGGYYAALFFMNRPVETDAAPVGVSARIGVLFFITVRGETRRAWEIESLAYGPKRTSAMPIGMEVQLRNKGNVHVRPEIFVTVRNMFGQDVEHIELNSEGRMLLPSQSRMFAGRWGSDQHSGGGFWHELGNELKDVRLGRYQLKLEVRASGFTPIVRMMDVGFLPWRSFTLGGTAILVLFLVLKSYNRLRHRS